MSIIFNPLGALGSVAIHVAAFLFPQAISHRASLPYEPSSNCMCGFSDHMIFIPIPELFLSSTVANEFEYPVVDPVPWNRCSAESSIVRNAGPGFPVTGSPRIMPPIFGAEADPVICADINEQGRITRAYMLRSSGEQQLDHRLLAKLRTLPFEPARSVDGPVASRHRVTILRDASQPV